MVVTGLPERDALPWIAVSASIHLPYVLALARAYEHGDFSLAYPLARGGGALVAAIGGLVLLDDELSMLGWFAIAVVDRGAGVVRPTGHVVAVAAVGAARRRAHRRLHAGRRHRRPPHRRHRLRARHVRRHRARRVAVGLPHRAGAGDGADRSARSWRPYLTSGLASATAYGLVLYAVRWAPVGYVTALRESSVVLAAVAGWRLLAEGFGRTRVASSAVVLSGLVLLVIAR